MLKKKEYYLNVTPIPAQIPRQLALDILHSHSEIITLSPLVISHNSINPPRDAPADEYYHTWYEIHERVQYVPGLGKFGSGKISFKGSFNNTPWGIQTHTYVPLGIELQSQWRIAGNQPGEPPEPLEERADGAPANGLYLREDIEITCNRTLISFVKTQLKAASKVLIERLIKKAELLDAGVLQVMFEDGKLKTINPANRTTTFSQQPLYSPSIPFDQRSARLSGTGPTRSGSMSSTSTGSHAPYTPSLSQHAYGPGTYRTVAAELPGSVSYLQPSPGLGKHFEIAEMEGSGYPPQDQGFRSPMPHQGHAVELPAMAETSEEYAIPRNPYPR